LCTLKWKLTLMFWKELGFSTFCIWKLFNTIGFQIYLLELLFCVVFSLCKDLGDLGRFALYTHFMILSSISNGGCGMTSLWGPWSQRHLGLGVLMFLFTVCTNCYEAPWGDLSQWSSLITYIGMLGGFHSKLDISFVGMFLVIKVCCLWGFSVHC
jgi:hypothetical protein